MKKLASGLVIVKAEENNRINARVSLTRKTMKSGHVRYAVVLTNMRNHNHNRLNSFRTISEAWDLYKSVRAI